MESLIYRIFCSLKTTTLPAKRRFTVILEEKCCNTPLKGTFVCELVSFDWQSRKKVRNGVTMGGKQRLEERLGVN